MPSPLVARFFAAWRGRTRGRVVEYTTFCVVLNLQAGFWDVGGGGLLRVFSPDAFLRRPRSFYCKLHPFAMFLASFFWPRPA